MKTRPRHPCIAALLLVTLSRLTAAETPLIPVFESTTGLAGQQVKLVWSPQSNVVYRVEKSTTLTADGPGGWSVRALVEGGEWIDPEPPGQRAFYRVPAPLPEVFSLEPAVVARSGGQITLVAQCLPPGSVLLVEIPGEQPQTLVLPLTPGPDGTWRATMPNLPPGLPVVATLSVVDIGGLPVATVGQTLEITDSGLATESLPSEPPAWRAAVLKPKTKSNQSNDRQQASIKQGHYAVSNFQAAAAGADMRVAEGEDEDCDGSADDSDPDASFSLLMPALMKAKEKANRTKCRNNLRFTGWSGGGCTGAGALEGVAIPKFLDYMKKGKRSEAELNLGILSRTMGTAKTSEAKNSIGAIARTLPHEVGVDQEVLSLATPAGPDIALSLHYRSRAGTGGVSSSTLVRCGHGWTCSYDIRIVPLPLQDGANAKRLLLFGGDGRSDVLVRQEDGSYRGDGMFREGRFDPDTTFRLTFADKSQFIFCPLVGVPWSGRIGSIADANGVAIQFTYDSAARLVTISSQFGQSLALDYDSDGRLDKATDHTGRFVECDYFTTGEPGGNLGDLKSVSCPQVVGQPPLMGPAAFTYTTGNLDDRLNHNLLTALDGAGRLLEEFTYSPVTNAASIEFDTVASVNCDRTQLTGHVTLMKFELVSPVPGSPVAYRCIVNDPAGRVTECDFDAQHRCVACREFTGFATPGVVVTSSTNRPNPATRLRAGDPEFFQTQCRYNPDHRIKIRTLADGTQERCTYGRELDRDCPVRERGNAHTITLRSVGGAERTVTCDYLRGFGTCEAGWFGTDCSTTGRLTKSRSNIQNNRIGGGTGVLTSFQPPSYEVEDVSQAAGPLGGPAFGLVVPDCATNPIPGVGVVIKRNHGASAASVAGNPVGGLTIKGGRNHRLLDGQHGLGGGSVWDGGDGNGGCTDAARGVDKDGRDCTGPRPHRMTRLLTSHGQMFTWSYDSHGNCTGMRTPVEGSGCDFTYNALGQCTSVTVLNGAASPLLETYTYDAVSGFVVNSHTSPFDLNITTTFEHDTLGRVTRVVNPRGHDWLTEYDPCDRTTVSRTPGGPGVSGMPSRISMSCFYDAGGLLVRCDLEHRDASGALVAANPAYTTWAVYDSRGHLSRMASEQRPVDAGVVVTPVNDPPTLLLSDWSVCDFTYNDAGECVQARVPAASRGQNTAAVCLADYDERGFGWQCRTGLPGDPGGSLVQLDYTPVGMVARCSLLPTQPPPGVPPLETVLSYDGFQRLASVTDPMGNMTQCDYDEQGFTTVSVFGEVNDVPGSAGNVLLARGRSRTASHKHVFQHNETDLQFIAARAINTNGHGTWFRFRPAFFDIFADDDVWTLERFAPGAPGPHETETTTVHRSPAGLVDSVTRNGDVLVSCTYDTAWRLQTVQDARVVVALIRDAAGNVTSSTRTDSSTVPGGPSAALTYVGPCDALGRRLSISDSVGNTTVFTYDSCSRLTETTDPLGVVHRFHYDGETGGGGGGAPVPFSVLHACDVDGDGTAEILGHFRCQSGVCSDATDSKGYTTTFHRDSAGNLTQCDFPDGTHENYGFDSHGRCHSITHKDGTVVVADLDRDGRLDLVTYSGGPPTAVPVPPTDYRYDGLGRPVQCDQGASHLAFTWDSMGNQTSESHNGLTVTRTFNHRGRTGIVFPDATIFIEARDQFGNIQSISRANSAGAAITPPVTQVDYLGHRPQRETRADGVVTTLTYRGDGDPPIPGPGDDFTFDGCVSTVCTNAGGTVIYSTRVRRDRAQNVTQHYAFHTGDPQAPGRRHVYTLDRLGRLTACVISRREVVGGPMLSESSVTYTLDLAGRRLTAVGGRNPGVYVQNPLIPPGDDQMGQYSSWPRGPLEWNDQGCLTMMSRASGPQQYIYDQASRLVEVIDAATGATVATYAYDALGRRTRSSVPGSDPLLPPVDTFFVHDGADCVQELGADSLPNFTMAAIGIGPCISTRNGTILYPHGGSDSDGGSNLRRKPKRKKFNSPNLPAEVIPLELVPETDPVLTFRSQGSPSANAGLTGTFFTSSTGTIIERLDCDDAGYPIFLTSDGMPRPAATDLLSGFRWLAPDGIWCPESGLFQFHGSVYSPDLGGVVAEEKKKDKEAPRKKTYVGHVTLMK
ncbi:MAG: RHS repeat protein [Verrucomicrobiales bacterium]|nr:RHS repeat protein [Verrucomicrobiales bacterium]